MYYKSYQNMRDATWKILLDCGIDQLPVDMNVICKNLGVRVLSYEDSASVIEQAHLYQVVRRTDGLTFYLRNTPVILFDETLEFEQAVFTVAHELGHLILGHVMPENVPPIHQGVKWEATPEEKAANQFAARLLAPACPIWGLDLHTAEEIMGWCQVPRPAAEYRAKRMATLYKRQKFLTSPLEQALYQQFLPFISSCATGCPPLAM